MIAPSATWIVAEVQVYSVAVEVVRRLNDVIFPEKILQSNNLVKLWSHLNVLLPPVPPTALLLLTPAAACK